MICCWSSYGGCYDDTNYHWYAFTLNLLKPTPVERLQLTCMKCTFGKALMILAPKSLENEFSLSTFLINLCLQAIRKKNLTVYLN